MPELEFAVTSATVERFAAQPMLDFELHLRNSGRAAIRSVILQCQLRIEARRRSYSAAEQARLKELFGPPQGWRNTLRSLLWAQVQLTVPFTGDEARTRLPVPCSYDFNLAMAKYLYGVVEGEVPLLFLFSGTILYEDATGAVRITQIPHDKEAGFRLPVERWRELMDHYYPHTAWLQLSRQVFDRIDGYKRERGFLSWDGALESLLAAQDEARL